MLKSEKVGRPQGGKITQYHIDVLKLCCFRQQSFHWSQRHLHFFCMANDIMGNIFTQESLSRAMNVFSH